MAVERENQKIQELKKALYAEARAKYDAERLKENLVVSLQRLLLAAGHRPNKS